MKGGLGNIMKQAQAMQDNLRKAQEQLHLHSWNLRQLVPAKIQRAYRPRAPRPTL